MIKLEWQKMPKADYIRIYVWIEHFGQWEIVDGSPKVVGEHGQWYDSFKVAGDGIYLIKLATVTCGEQRNLSEGIVVTFGEYVPQPTPIPDPPTPPSDARHSTTATTPTTATTRRLRRDDELRAASAAPGCTDELPAASRRLTVKPQFGNGNASLD